MKKMSINEGDRLKNVDEVDGKKCR